MYRYRLLEVGAGDDWRGCKSIIGKIFISPYKVPTGKMTLVDSIDWDINQGPAPEDLLAGNGGRHKRLRFVNALFEEVFEPQFEPQKEKIIMRSPEAIRKEVTEYAASVPPERLKAIPAGLKGRMVSELNRVFSCNENRRFIVGWLFTGSFANELSTSDMSEAQIAGLLHWLQPSHEKTGWVVAPMFKAEAALMYAYVAREHVKTTTYKASGSAQKMKISPSLLSAIKEN